LGLIHYERGWRKLFFLAQLGQPGFMTKKINLLKSKIVKIEKLEFRGVKIIRRSQVKWIGEGRK
jgi:hypothetical protein